MIVTVFRSRLRPENRDEYTVWATRPEHVAAKKKGREGFYSDYSIQVCEPIRSHAFKLDEHGGGA